MFFPVLESWDIVIICNKVTKFKCKSLIQEQEGHPIRIRIVINNQSLSENLVSYKCPYYICAVFEYAQK